MCGVWCVVCGGGGGKEGGPARRLAAAGRPAGALAMQHRAARPRQAGGLPRAPAQRAVLAVEAEDVVQVGPAAGRVCGQEVELDDLRARGRGRGRRVRPARRPGTLLQHLRCHSCGIGASVHSPAGRQHHPVRRQPPQSAPHVAEALLHLEEVAEEGAAPGHHLVAAGGLGQPLAHVGHQVAPRRVHHQRLSQQQLAVRRLRHQQLHAGLQRWGAGSGAGVGAAGWRAAGGTAAGSAGTLGRGRRPPPGGSPA